MSSHADEPCIFIMTVNKEGLICFWETIKLPLIHIFCLRVIRSSRSTNHTSIQYIFD